MHHLADRVLRERGAHPRARAHQNVLEARQRARAPPEEPERAARRAVAIAGAVAIAAGSARVPNRRLRELGRRPRVLELLERAPPVQLGLDVADLVVRILPLNNYE